jgi:hypothetical protein
MDDPRLTPARPDLAAKYLEGKIEAALARNSKLPMRSRHCASGLPPMRYF